jgi:hypothetical protein
VVALEVEFGPAHVKESGSQRLHYGGSAAYVCADPAVIAHAELAHATSRVYRPRSARPLISRRNGARARARTSSLEVSHTALVGRARQDLSINVRPERLMTIIMMCRRWVPYQMVDVSVVGGWSGRAAERRRAKCR